MAKKFAQGFYSSEAWNKCRAAYKKSVGGLCECCLAKGLYNPGTIVHHKIHITPQNIEIPEIALDWSNLELVCRECHAEKHGKKSRRYVVDPIGRVVAAR